MLSCVEIHHPALDIPVWLIPFTADSGQSYYFQLDNPTEPNELCDSTLDLVVTHCPVSLSLLHCFVMLAHVHIVYSCVVFMWHAFCNSVLVLYLPPWS